MACRRCSICNLYYPVFTDNNCRVCETPTWIDHDSDLPPNWGSAAEAAKERYVVEREEGEPEGKKILLWRTNQLLDAGYPIGVAEAIACNMTIDLHRACDLLEQGCDLETAEAILL